MKTQITVCLVVLISMVNVLYGATFTSAGSGLYSEGSTWVGGTAPAPMDNIIIATGHTVTLDEAAASYGQVLVYNITIQEGATLDNSIYKLKIASNYTGNPVYSNNGVHNGSGNLVMYDLYDTEITGSGIVNCTMEITRFGISMASGCNLTVNANIQHSVPGNSGMNSKEFIGCWTGDTHLTVNGDIVTDPLYMVGIHIVAGSSITVNGNVYLGGGTESGSGSNITNSGSLDISGDLLLGPSSGYCQNYGTVAVGGDLLGSGSTETYFLQEAGARLRIGGSIFPSGNEGMLHTSGLGLISYLPIEPNTVEYNGAVPQTVALPVSDQHYSQLEINNTHAAGVSLASDITVSEELIFTDGMLFLGGFNLILPDSASVSGAPSASAMCVASGTGQFKRALTTTGNYLFPVGDTANTNSYTPVWLEFLSGSFAEGVAGVNLKSAAWPEVPASSANYLNRYWNVSSSGISDFSCNARFTYAFADVAGLESLLWCYRFAPDTLLFNPVDTLLNELSALNLTAFGSFTGMDNIQTTLPLAFPVTGSGSYCSGDAGLPVGLGGSEPGVIYTLFKDDVPQEPAVAGTGEPLSFGIQTAGTYTVEGSNSAGTVLMEGNAVLVENPSPIVEWPTFDPDTLCLQWPAVQLTGGTPEGGVYSGNGVIGGSLFDPAEAGSGTHLITYTYTDTVGNGNGCSGQASLVLFVDLCTGVTVQNTAVTIYPNPASETVSLIAGTLQPIQQVRLCNLMGSVVYRNDHPVLHGSASNVLTIPVNSYPSGHYVLIINTANETLVKKLLIAR